LSTEWQTNGYQEEAVDLLVNWVKEQNMIAGLKLEVIKEEGRTPLVFMEVPAFGEGARDETVLLYGHLDKQPPLTEFWAEGLHPHKPVIRDGKLYGRGGADDGYSIFAAVAALGALQAQGMPHSRCVITIEACEESGSKDLPYYIESLKERIGEISLVVCLDSGCGNYEQLWLTTSLRGIVVGSLKVNVLTEGVHSGASSGVVPSSFRVLRHLISRLEDPETGVISHEAFQCELPKLRVEQADKAAEVLGDEVWTMYPWAGKMTPAGTSNAGRLLAKTWKPALSVTGVNGMPDLVSAGNVLRPYTAVKLSLRLPPNCDAKQAAVALKEILEKDPPYNATVSFEADKGATGWEAPPMVDWLEKAATEASKSFYGGKPHQFIGEGGYV
jgi:acetylornithine deacetylase/succinyl-diaminopimelate desuccinylase-like protein